MRSRLPEDAHHRHRPPTGYPSRLTFGDLAPILAGCGYQLRADQARHEGARGDRRLDQPRPPDDVPAAVRRNWGTGMLTAHTPAIDLDVRDKGIVRILLRLAEDMFDGPSPIRVGQFPKALCRSRLTASRSPRSPRAGSPGPTRTGPPKASAAHRVEMLADGEQFVAFGRHPRGTAGIAGRADHCSPITPSTSPRSSSRRHSAFVDAADAHHARAPA